MRHLPAAAACKPAAERPACANRLQIWPCSWRACAWSCGSRPAPRRWRALHCAAAAAEAGACHYQTLGVPRTASKDEVKKAFRRLAREWHPDVNSSASATERFKAISAAFECLSDEQQRRQYDFARFGSSRRARSAGSRTASSNSSFPGEPLPADISAELHLDFREAALGTQRSITLELLDACRQCGGSGAQPGTLASPCGMCKGRREIVKRGGMGGPAGSAAGGANFVVCCPVCAGRGFDATQPCTCCRGVGLRRQPRQVAVRVPAGVDDGSILRLAGQGDLSRVGGPKGAVVLELKVVQEEGIWRQGLDLHSQLAVPLWDALLGSTATVSTLRGDASLTIPPGTQHGAVLSLKEAGVQRESANRKQRRCGAHYFEVRVEVPRQVSSTEQQLLQRLAELQRQRQCG